MKFGKGLFFVHRSLLECSTLFSYSTGLISRNTVELTNEVLVELKQMRDVRHNNLNQFIGACVEPCNVMIVYQ